MLFYKSTDTIQRKISPTSADLELIQQYALPGEPVNAEELFIGRMALANDQYDRSHERFPESYLLRFAETIPGKAVMTGHDYSQVPVGRFYTAEVSGREGRKELVPSYYLRADDPLTAKIKAGIARHVSIGFEPDLRTCDLCEKDYDGWHKGEEEDPCSHIAGREYDGKRCTVTYGGDVQKVEAVEGSFVWLGCQYNAEALGANRHLGPTAKAAYFDGRAGKGIWVPAASARHFLPVDHDGLTARLPVPSKEWQGAADPKAASALPDKAALTEEQERLIAAGQKYRERLLARIKQRYDACEMEETGAALLQALQHAPIEALEGAEANAEKQFEKQFPPVGLGVPASAQPVTPAIPKFDPLRALRFPRG